MARTPNPPDNDAIRKTANAAEQLVSLNQEASKQTTLLVILTTVITILTLVMALPILMSFFSKENWTGFYYPDKDNIGDESLWKIQKEFSNLEECRAWIEDTAGENTNYDYECGFNCRQQGELNICKKTVQ